MPSDSIVGALIGASATIVIGGAAIFFSRKRKKIIVYDISSMALLRFSPIATPIFRVSVDKFTLTGEPADSGKWEEINNAYGFEVRLQNHGKEHITPSSGKQPTIKIQLDKEAKIVHWETDPRSENVYNILVEKGEQPNAIFVSPPYINSKQQILVRVISTGNKTRECHVEAYGEGLKAQPNRGETRQLMTFAILMLISLLTVMAIFVANPQALIDSFTFASPLIVVPVLIASLIFGVCAAGVLNSLMSKSASIRSERGWDKRKHLRAK